MACAPGIHPREASRPTRSEAEKEVWKALRDRLPSGWYAWHSLRIRDPGAILGEGDFVLAHPQRGFLVVEVKGGRLERRDGRWFQNGKALDPAPLDQGVRFAKRLARRLGDFDCAAPAYGAVVYFPDTDFEKGPGGDDYENVVLGRRQLQWLGDALPGAVERALPPAQEARGAWVERLHTLWLVQLDLDLVDRLRTEVADVQQVGLAAPDQLAHGVDALALEAVVRPHRQVELLDRHRERGDVGDLGRRGADSMPSASTLSSRDRPNSSTRVWPALATASRGVIDGLVSTSTTSRSKSVRCSTRVASTA